MRCILTIGEAERYLRQSNHSGRFETFDASAVADEEFVAVYYDTLTNPALTGMPDPLENRAHIPLGLKIRQHSYSFGGPPDDDFILLRYTMTNIGYQLSQGRVYRGCIWIRMFGIRLHRMDLPMTLPGVAGFRPLTALTVFWWGMLPTMTATQTLKESGISTRRDRCFRPQ